MKHKINDWIKEILARADSSQFIIQALGERLNELEEITETLRAENLALRNDKKVEEYENKIQTLEYQLELLKRQMKSDVSFSPVGEDKDDANCILLLTSRGQILHLEAIEGIKSIPLAGKEEGLTLVATSVNQEALCLFSSGRTATLPIRDIPQQTLTSIDWSTAFLQEPRAGETATTLLPIGRMALYENCIQISRRGSVKRMKRSAVEGYLRNQFIGSGIRIPKDQTFQLVLGNDQDSLILVSHEGFLFNLTINQLPFTIEEVLRLSNTDYIVAAFALPHETDFAALTQTGKVLHRQPDWLEAAESFKSQGQAMLSPARRDNGIRILTAGSVQPNSWGVGLNKQGELFQCDLAAILSAGNLENVHESNPLIAWAFFTP